MKKESNPSYRRFGYLVGLKGDQIAYATQASEGAVIVHEGTEIKVNVLMENFNQVEERMYIALDKDNLEKLENLKTLSVSNAPFKSHLKLKVEFELKSVSLLQLLQGSYQVCRHLQQIVKSGFQSMNCTVQKISSMLCRQLPLVPQTVLQL